MPEENRNRWFLGELFVGGFTNQQFGILGMVPVAQLLNSSLIVGPISTRKSFAHTWDQFSGGIHDWSFPLAISMTGRTFLHTGVSVI